MTYQPPIIGSKQLLNFVAHSYPETGGYVLIIKRADIGDNIKPLRPLRRRGEKMSIPKTDMKAIS
jgi:hypothetical protein